MRIITNADDFGYDEDTVRATIEAFEKNALTSATIMPRMPATQQAVDYAAKNPQKSFGVHLTYVSDGIERPILDATALPALCEPGGQFLPSNTVRMRALLHRIPVDQIERETAAQIQFLIDQGVRISHVDSHGHLHKFAPFREALRRVLPRFGIRRVRAAQDIFFTRKLLSPTYWLGPTWRRKLRAAFTCPEHFYMPASLADTGWPQLVLSKVLGQTLEVGVHPGYSEAWRKSDLECVQQFAEEVVKRGHTLIGWAEL